MKMIEFVSAKGGKLWVNADQVLYVAPPDGANSSMYGDNNVRAVTRLHLTQGVNIEVRETAAEVVARLNG